MPVFQYAAYTPAGGIETGKIDAQSGEEALGLLAARGLTPFETREMRRPRRSLPLASRAGIASEDIALLARELATMLEAQVPVDETLRLLAGQVQSARSRRLVEALLTDILSGASLSSALARHEPDIPPLMISLVRAGEVRGALGPTLSEIARLLESRAEVRGRVRSALIYPLALAAIAAGTLVIILTVLFPSLIQLFEESGSDPPLVLALARDAVQLLETQWALLLPAFSMLTMTTGFAFTRPGARRSIARILGKLPLIGDLRRKLTVAAFTRTLGTLLRNGVQVVEALSIAAGVVRGTHLGERLRDVTVSIQQGSKLSAALAASDALPSAATRLIAIGEESNRVDAMLLHLADMYDREAARALERAMTLLSPLITVAIGIVVGGIILSVMQAVLSVNTLALN
jgi:general secretion pathway protein F